MSVCPSQFSVTALTIFFILQIMNVHNNVRILTGPDFEKNRGLARNPGWPEMEVLGFGSFLLALVSCSEGKYI